MGDGIHHVSYLLESLLWLRSSQWVWANDACNSFWSWCLIAAQFSINPGSLWFIAIDFVIGKRECVSGDKTWSPLSFYSVVYANSLLASLNSRSALRGRNHTHDEGTSFRVNTINLTGLQSSSDRDSTGGTQSKTTASTISAPARARVKPVPGGDIDQLEVGFFSACWSDQLTTEMKTGNLGEVWCFMFVSCCAWLQHALCLPTTSYPKVLCIWPSSSSSSLSSSVIFILIMRFSLLSSLSLFSCILVSRYPTKISLSSLMTCDCTAVDESRSKHM